MKTLFARMVLGLGALALTVSAAPPPPAAPLRVGAAKVDITPPPAELLAPFTSVADRVYLRALVIESAGRRAVMVIADVPTINAKVADDIASRISTAAGVPRTHIILGATHTHNVMRVDPTTKGIILPGSAKYVEQVTAAAVKAVKKAEAALQPARAGVGKGSARLVGNRNVWSPEHGRYIADVDRDGVEPIDHGLGVIKFESLDGKPIAWVLNYAFEPIITMAIKSEVSGDVPGATSRMIEERAGGVALFTIGAAGVPYYRSEDTPEPQRRAHTLRLLETYGTMLTEEALAVGARMAMRDGAVAIAGAARPLICPGKATSPFNLPDRCAHKPGSDLPACDFKTVDAPPTTLNIGVVRIGDVAIVQTDANIAPALGTKLQRVTPVANTWIVALTFGPMRFVVDDAAYAHNTYEATATTAKPGCAEQGYLKGAIDLIDRSR